MLSPAQFLPIRFSTIGVWLDNAVLCLMVSSMAREGYVSIVEARKRGWHQIDRWACPSTKGKVYGV